MIRCGFKIGAGLACVLLVSIEAGAYPVHRRLAREVYGATVACELCHGYGGGTERNPYGLQWQEHGEDVGAFEKIDGKDADGDASSNGDEIRAGSNPGSPDSTPASPGRYERKAQQTPIPTLQLELVLPEADEYLASEPDLDERQRGGLQESLGRPLSPDERFPTVYFSVLEGRRTAAALFAQGKAAERHFSLLLGIGLDGKIGKVVMFRAGKDTGALYRPYLNCLVGKGKDELPPKGTVACAGATGELGGRKSDLKLITDAVRGALWTLWTLFAAGPG